MSCIVASLPQQSYVEALIPGTSERDLFVNQAIADVTG